MLVRGVAGRLTVVPVLSSVTFNNLEEVVRAVPKD
jgi:hypothetical protein